MNSLNTSWFNSSLAFYILSHTLSLHYSCCHQMNFFFFINGKVAPHRSEDKSKQNCPTLGLVIGIFWTTIFYICQNFIITRCLITSVCWWRVNQTLMVFFFLFAFMKDLVSKTVSVIVHFWLGVFCLCLLLIIRDYIVQTLFVVVSCLIYME